MYPYKMAGNSMPLRLLRLRLVLVLMGFGFSITALPAQYVHVAAPSGVYVGQVEGDVASFRGVPYAQAPVGNLRWRPPVPAKLEDTIYALEWPPPCPQRVFDADGSASSIGEEDCLYLNIWAPQGLTKPAPVMVFIHGGGNVQGSTAQMANGAHIYDGTALAHRGKVVVVTIQYRLGALGYLVHPALELLHPRGRSGNYGLMDQILALQWVRRNISAFGGDTSHITIFGESAGSVNVGCLLMSPLSRGLFHRAIMQSGTPIVRPYDSLRIKGVQAAQKWGCQIGDLKSQLACLQSLPVDSLLNVQEKPFRDGIIRPPHFGPVVDDWVMVEPFNCSTPLPKSFQTVPLLIGSNTEETALSAPRIVLPTVLEHFFHSILSEERADSALMLYPHHSRTEEAREAYIQATTDMFFTMPTRLFARKAAEAGAPVWRYVFDHRLRPFMGRKSYAFHGLELFFVFGSIDSTIYGKRWMRPIDARIRDAMIHYWSSFAARGVPDKGPFSEWIPYHPVEDNYLLIGQQMANHQHFRPTKSDFWERECLLRVTRSSSPTTSPIAAFKLRYLPSRHALRLILPRECRHFGPLTVFIFDASGRVVYSHRIPSRALRGNRFKTIELPLPPLPAGQYFLSTSSGCEAPKRVAFVVPD